MQTPTPRELMEAALDIAQPRQVVEIKVSEDQDRLWVNVDGVCILRINQIPNLKLEVPE